MDANVVPDAAASGGGGGADISNAHYNAAQGSSMELFFCPPLQLPSQFPMNREAKVLRYREKRKARKFEKTIRYASRKAYAEARPRIKGRFATRAAVELEIDQMFSASAPSEGSYGVVPSF